MWPDIIQPLDTKIALEEDRPAGFRRGRRDRCPIRTWHAGQKLTKSLMAASAFDGTTLRATKSSQFLNLPLARASTMALARAGPICGSVSSSVAVAVLRLILLTTGAVVVGFAGFAGVVTAGAAGLTVVAFERKPEPRSHQEVPQPKECDESTCVLSCIEARATIRDVRCRAKRPSIGHRVCYAIARRCLHESA